MTARWGLQPSQTPAGGELGEAASARRAHIPYWNEVLQEDYCREDGEPWPCLWVREHQPPACKCSHSASQHTNREGQCWSRVCGCATYRPKETSQ